MSCAAFLKFSAFLFDGVTTNCSSFSAVKIANFPLGLTGLSELSFSLDLLTSFRCLFVIFPRF